MPLISRDYLVLVSDVKYNKIFKKENHLEVFQGTGVNASELTIGLAAALQHRPSAAHR